jgi:hypothetical protein
MHIRSTEISKEELEMFVLQLAHGTASSKSSDMVINRYLVRRDVMHHVSGSFPTSSLLQAAPVLTPPATFEQ